MSVLQIWMPIRLLGTCFFDINEIIYLLSYLHSLFIKKNVFYHNTSMYDSYIST